MNQTLIEKIAEAVKLAHPVFVANGWKYWRSNPIGEIHPDELFNNLVSLVLGVLEQAVRDPTTPKFNSSGRFVVQYMPYDTCPQPEKIPNDIEILLKLEG